MNIAYAAVDYNQVFMDMDPYVVIYDLNKNKIVENFNSTECTKRISPCSTFKVPLSLMGYDNGILKDADHQEWEFNPEYDAKLEIWKKDHNPRSWMANSVVWYSKVLLKN